jgi:hypothetical protein
MCAFLQYSEEIIQSIYVFVFGETEIFRETLILNTTRPPEYAHWFLVHNLSDCMDSTALLKAGSSLSMAG